MNKIPIFTPPLPKCVCGLELTSTAETLKTFQTIYIHQTANSQFCLNLPICHSQREDKYKSLMLQRTNSCLSVHCLIPNAFTYHHLQWHHLIFHHRLTDATHWQFIHTATPKYFLVSRRRLRFHMENDASVNDVPVHVLLDTSTCEGKNLEQCLVHLGANGCWLRQDKGTLVLTNIITL